MAIDISQSLNEAARSAAAPVQGLIRGVESGINTGLLISQERDRKRKLQAEMDAQVEQRKRQEVQDALTMIEKGFMTDKMNLEYANNKIIPYFNEKLPKDKQISELASWPNDGKDLAKKMSQLFKDKDMTQREKDEVLMGYLAEKGIEWFKHGKDYLKSMEDSNSPAKKDEYYLTALKLYGHVMQSVAEGRAERDDPGVLQVERMFFNEAAKYNERHGTTNAPGAPPPPLNPPAGPEEPGMFSNLFEKAAGVVGKLMPGKSSVAPSAAPAPKTSAPMKPPKAGMILISNGKERLWIDPSKEAEAAKDGYVRVQQ